MANRVFPAALAAIQDSQYFETDYEDKSIKGEVDGGYLNVRPRHTRRPRRTFKTGFTEISQEHKELLESFYDEVGCYLKFDYTDPTSGKLFTVRFDKPFAAKYKGIGKTRLWNIQEVVLKEV